MLAALAAPVLVAGCDGAGGEVTCNADLSSDAGRKVKMFLETSNALIRAAEAIDGDMLAACRGMASDLGIPGAELNPAVGMENVAGERTRVACVRVKTEIDKILLENAKVGTKIAVVYTPAVCTIDASAQTRCVRECQPVTVTVTELMCTPGKFTGSCTANCMGSCEGSCAGSCGGSCAGTCGGTCMGNCNGMCNGTCSAMNADGSCYGTCTGTCTGTCEGTCMGSCSGSCSGSCTAMCMGTCSGDCSAGWNPPPKCTEVMKSVVVDDCNTTCESKAKFEASCTDPKLTVTYGFQATAAQKAQLDKLLTALRNHYAKFLKVSFRAGTMVVTAAEGYSAALTGVTATANMVGLQAGACVASAIQSTARALAQVNVSVSVSVMVSASASASGGVP
jgi:hypothetical protein